MSTLAINSRFDEDALAETVWFDSASMMHVRLTDRRVISVPVDWFPRLRNASDAQRQRWRLIGGGEGIHWEEIDEDLSVEGLLQGNRPSFSSARYRSPLKQRRGRSLRFLLHVIQLELSRKGRGR